MCKFPDDMPFLCFSAKLKLSFDEQNVVMNLLEENEKKIVDLEHLLAATQGEKEVTKADNRCQTIAKDDVNTGCLVAEMFLNICFCCQATQTRSGEFGTAGSCVPNEPGSEG